MKTSELSGAHLDAAVAKLEGRPAWVDGPNVREYFTPSTDARLAAIAFLGCMAFASAAYNTVAPLMIAAARAVKAWVLDCFKLATQVDEPRSRPAVVLLQAKACVLRLAKRERPQLSDSWRMCPLT